MSHYFGLIILASCVAAVFAMVTKETREERIRYFLSLAAYMILGSLITAWIMYAIP